MSPLSLVLLLATQAPTPPATPTPVAGETAGEPAAIDEGAIVDAVEEILSRGRDVVRLAVPPVNDENEARRATIELALVRAIRDRRREDVITPAWVRAKLKGMSETQLQDQDTRELAPLAADHVLLVGVLEQGGQSVLQMKLLFAETGQVLGESQASLGVGAHTTASAANVRTTTDRIAEQIAFGVEGSGADVRTHRVAVSPLKAEGAAANARLDRFVQAELLRALRRRGFLVVEREQLAEAANQLALGQVLEETNAPQVGRMLGAQSLVVGNVAEAGATFLVTVRAISAETGDVLAAASAPLPRDDVVTMAAVETRTPLEAALRSAVAPGWGQAYNGEGAKALAFGLGGYGALATTVGLGVAGVIAETRYNNVAEFEKLPVEERGAAVQQARQLANGFYLATAVAGGVTAGVWSLGIVDAFLGGPED